jgi:PAS domain S-box-containing protein
MNGTSSESVIKNQLIKALNSSMDGIALLDAAGNYYYLNQEHIIMFVYEKEEELLGKNWQCIYNNEEIERINKDIFPILIENKQWRGETIGKSKQGMPVYQEISLTMMEDGVIICICRDIRDKQEATKNLLLHYKIMENTKSMVIITNPNQEIEWVNKSFCDISGYTLEECIGKKPGRLLQGKDSDKAVIAGIRQNILDKNPFQAELLNYKKNGNPYWIEIKGQPLFNNQGEIEHFFAIEEDITTRKESQKKLEESNLRLELALKGISAATWELNLVTGEIYYSDFLYEMTGYEAHEIKNLFGENRFFMPEDDRDNTFNEFSAFLKSTAANFEREYRIKHKKGYDIWVLNRATISEKNKNGTPRKVIGIIIDITKIKETQKKLEESENRYKKTMEASGAAIWEWDLINDKIYTTQEFRNMLGLPSEMDFEISYKTLQLYVHPDDREMMETAIQNHFAGKTPKMDIDYRFKRLDTGLYEWYNFKGAVIEKTLQNTPVKAMGYSSSIQERKLIENQLKESEERWYNAMVVSGAGFWEYDSAQHKMYFSNRMRQILGHDTSNHISYDLSYWEQRVHPEDLEMLKTKISNIHKDKINNLSVCSSATAMALDSPLSICVSRSRCLSFSFTETTSIQSGSISPNSEAISIVVVICP